MARGFNIGLIEAMLDELIGGSNANLLVFLPDPFYIALSTTTPDTSGNNFTEPVGNNYARVSSLHSAYDPAGTTVAGRKDNTAAVSGWTASGGSWGTITHWGLFALGSGGSPILWGSLDADRTILDGDDYEFPANGLRTALANQA